MKAEAVHAILKSYSLEPKNESATADAATNIALCKYWGKRDDELNLPLTDSLSVMLPGHGVSCRLYIQDRQSILVNKEPLDMQSSPAKKLIDYLNLFLKTDWQLNLHFNIPVAAGFASSAACYASIIKTLDKLFEWNLLPSELSALARLGSGSACRSIEPGFSVWQTGEDTLGRDSVAYTLPDTWPDLCIGLAILSTDVKSTSSREGMKRTRNTSILYQSWRDQVAHDMPILLNAIKTKNFKQLAETAEHNAMSMHATMASAWPPLCYTTPKTRALQQRIWNWRAQGKAIYFTQDAGPNLKLLFERKDADWLKKQLPELQVIMPFSEKAP